MNIGGIFEIYIYRSKALARTYPTLSYPFLSCPILSYRPRHRFAEWPGTDGTSVSSKQAETS